MPRAGPRPRSSARASPPPESSCSTPRRSAAVNAYKGTAYAAAPSLFVELAGSEEGVAGDLEAVREVAGVGGVHRARARARRGGPQPALGGTPPRALRAAGGLAGEAAQVDGRLRAALAARARRRARARARGRARHRGVDRRACGRRELPRPLHARSRRPAGARGGGARSTARSSTGRSSAAGRAPASTGSGSASSATSSGSTATCSRGSGPSRTCSTPTGSSIPGRSSGALRE